MKSPNDALSERIPVVKQHMAVQHSIFLQQAQT